MRKFRMRCAPERSVLDEALPHTGLKVALGMPPPERAMPNRSERSALRRASLASASKTACGRHPRPRGAGLRAPRAPRNGSTHGLSVARP